MVATGIGQGLSTLAQSVFLDTSGASPTLSAFGALVVIFAGISLAIGLCRLKYRAAINIYKNLECFNANQNGSSYFKRFEHVQRIEIEPRKRIKYFHEIGACI